MTAGARHTVSACLIVQDEAANAAGHATGGWVLEVGADERITPELADELLAFLATPDSRDRVAGGARRRVALHPPGGRAVPSPRDAAGRALRRCWRAVRPRPRAQRYGPGQARGRDGAVRPGRPADDPSAVVARRHRELRPADPAV